MPGVGIRNQVKRAKAADGASIRFDLQFVILLILLLGAGLARAELSVLSFFDVHSWAIAMAWEGDPPHGDSTTVVFGYQGTNFGSGETNLYNSGGVSGASASSSVGQKWEIQPLWISLETGISTWAYADTNGDFSAVGNGYSSFNFRFELTLPHTYTLSNTFSRWPPSATLWSQLWLKDNLNRQYYLRELPDADGSVVQQGLLLPGNYHFMAYLELGQSGEAPSDGQNAGLAALLRLTPVLPHLGIARHGPNAILTWHTNFVGFQLQGTSDSLFGSWSNVGRAVVLVGDHHTVTVPIAVALGYYRLFKP